MLMFLCLIILTSFVEKYGFNHIWLDVFLFKVEKNQTMYII